MNLKKLTTPITRNAKLLVTSSLLIIMAVSILNTWGTAQTGDTSTPAQRLVGHAWSETIGWISFNDGSRPVTIDAYGNLVGYAWSENIGWIKFGGLTGFPKLALGKNALLRGEKLTGWARAVSGMTPAEYTEVDRLTTSTNAKAVSTKNADQEWIAFTAAGYGDYYVLLARLPAEKHTVEGNTFYVFNYTRVYRGGLASFKANPKQIINSLPDVAVGSTRNPDSRLIFNIAQLEAEPAGTRSDIVTNFATRVDNRFMCTTSQVNAPVCQRNNAGAWLPGIGYAPKGPVYVSYHDSGSGVQYGAGEVIGVYNMGTTETLNFPIDSTVKTMVKKDNRGGFDGWINLNGVYLNGPTNGTPPVKKFQGWAWGSDIIGWLAFDSVGVTTNLNTCTGPYGTAIADGQSFTYYSSPASDGSCQVEERHCANGTLDGSFTAIACGDTPDREVKKDFCSRAGKVVKDKQTATFYSQSTVRSGKSCEPYKAVLTCNNGLYTNAKGEEDIVHIYGNCRGLPSYGEI